MLLMINDGYRLRGCFWALYRWLAVEPLPHEVAVVHVVSSESMMYQPAPVMVIIGRGFTEFVRDGTCIGAHVIIRRVARDIVH